MLPLSESVEIWGSPKDLLRAVFEVALQAATPGPLIKEWARDFVPPTGRTFVIGAGKASAAMAKALEECLPGPLSGLVLTPYGHSEPTQRIEVVEASHPIPDEEGSRATERMLGQLLQGLDPQDCVIALMSGGGSSLLSLPAEGITLETKRWLTRALLASGASIAEINTVRKHLSRVKAGRLAVACAPARVVTLLLSDVPGDDLSTIASGPTLPDPTTAKDALEVLRRHGIRVPAEVCKHLESPAAETPKAGDPVFERVEAHLLGSPRIALEAAATWAKRMGMEAEITTDRLEGDSRVVGRQQAELALERADGGWRGLLLSGGETTVQVEGSGHGGRNVEFLMAMAERLAGDSRVHVLAADTDGIDGNDEVAGAIIGPTTLARGIELGYPIAEAMRQNDGHGFFSLLGDCVITGPTRTNVNDFHAILIS